MSGSRSVIAPTPAGREESRCSVPDGRVTRASPVRSQTTTLASSARVDAPRGAVGVRCGSVPLRASDDACRWVLLAALALVLAGCPEARTLTIDLQTDLVPELELGSVEISVLPRFVPHDTTAVAVHALTLEPSAADAVGLRAGLRVMEVTGLDRGLYTIRAVARRPVELGTPPIGGTFLAQQDVVADLDASRVVRVVIVGSCGRVSCPGVGDADRATECLNGHCVDPRCEPSRPERREYCCEGPSCADDARCTAASDCVVAPCAAPSCVDGACIAIDRGECGPDAYCDLTAGECLSVGGSTLRDAGPPDAGPPPDAVPLRDACQTEVCGNDLDDDCDGALDCEDTDCAGVACDDDDPCTHTDVCAPVAMEPGRCLGTAVDCGSTACATRTCNGTATCTETPMDGAPCPDDGSECTTDVCSGTTCTHVALPAGTACNGGAGRCCSGSCTDPLTDNTNCGICGISCAAAGTTCRAGLCFCPGTNSTCRIAGYGPDASCYDPGDGHRCNCQCVAGTSCFGQCPSGARCVEIMGNNFCEYP